MKRAKVSSMYEGKRWRKRRRTGEAVENSRKARKTARARKYKCRVNFALPNERTIVTRSMSMKAAREEENLHKEVVIKQVEEEEKKVEAKGEEEAVIGGLIMEKREDGLEEWPVTWTYEEEWVNGGEWWHPYWELMGGLDWVSRVDPYDLDGDFWEDDLWNLKNIKEIPKP